MLLIKSLSWSHKLRIVSQSPTKVDYELAEELKVNLETILVT